MLLSSTVVLPNDMIEEPLCTRFGGSSADKLPTAPTDKGGPVRLIARDSSKRGDEDKDVDETRTL